MTLSPRLSTIILDVSADAADVDDVDVDDVDVDDVDVSIFRFLARGGSHWELEWTL